MSQGSLAFVLQTMLLKARSAGRVAVVKAEMLSLSPAAQLGLIWVQHGVQGRVTRQIVALRG